MPPRPDPGHWRGSWAVAHAHDQKSQHFPMVWSCGRQMMVKSEGLLGSRLHSHSFTSPEGAGEAHHHPLQGLMAAPGSPVLLASPHHVAATAPCVHILPAGPGSALRAPVVARASQSLCVPGASRRPGPGVPQSLPNRGSLAAESRVLGEGELPGAALRALPPHGHSDRHLRGERFH